MIDKLKFYGWALTAVLLASLLLVQTLRLSASHLETSHVELKLSKYKAEVLGEQVKDATRLAKAEKDLRALETKLQAASASNRKVTNEQARVFSDQRDALLERVRNAERSRADQVDMPSTSAATGAGQAAGRSDDTELLGSFGEEDVQEAYRADLIRLHLASCYRDYDRAKAALESLSKAQ